MNTNPLANKRLSAAKTEPQEAPKRHARASVAALQDANKDTENIFKKTDQKTKTITTKKIRQKKPTRAEKEQKAREEQQKKDLILRASKSNSLKRKPGSKVKKKGRGGIKKRLSLSNKSNHQRSSSVPNALLPDQPASNEEENKEQAKEQIKRKSLIDSLNEQLPAIADTMKNNIEKSKSKSRSESTDPKDNGSIPTEVVPQSELLIKLNEIDIAVKKMSKNELDLAMGRDPSTATAPPSVVKRLSNSKLSRVRRLSQLSKANKGKFKKRRASVAIGNATRGKVNVQREVKNRKTVLGGFRNLNITLNREEAMSHEEWNRKHWKPLAPTIAPPGENDLDPPAPGASAEASGEASAEASEASKASEKERNDQEKRKSFLKKRPSLQNVKAPPPLSDTADASVVSSSSDEEFEEVDLTESDEMSEFRKDGQQKEIKVKGCCTIS